MSDCPHYWEQMMTLIHPVVMADSYAFADEDHIDDGVPDHAYEAPDLLIEEDLFA